MAITDSPAQFEIGRVVSRAFDALTRNAATFLPLALILMIPLLLLTLGAGLLGLQVAQAGKALAPGQLPRFFLAGGVLGLAYIACTYTLQAAIVQGTIQTLNDETATIGGCLATGLRLAFPVLLISIVVILGMMAGTVLLVVPGIILATGWIVAIPVRVIEQTGVRETLGRSWELTRGYRWRIFLLVLMYFVVALLVQFAIRPMLGLTLLGTGPGANGPVVLTVNWVISTFLATLTAVGVTSIYYELRLVKEGVAPQQLASVFD